MIQYGENLVPKNLKISLVIGSITKFNNRVPPTPTIIIITVI